MVTDNDNPLEYFTVTIQYFKTSSSYYNILEKLIIWVFDKNGELLIDNTSKPQLTGMNIFPLLWISFLGLSVITILRRKKGYSL